jgi:translation initiation factor IF-3
VKEKVRINNQIRARDLRVIDDEKGNLGVMSTEDALKLAKERGLDLIEISPEADPPIAKITDYGKFQYTTQKKESEARAKAHVTETKTVQIKIATGEHDLELKAKRISEWLKEGHRVKLDLYLAGRAKYLDPKFLDERLHRVLVLVSEDYKIAEASKRGPKGLSTVLERGKPKKDTKDTKDEKDVKVAKETKA